ncbi:hypothetical protein [Mucilaginibacter antarcticus]|uniref:Uncharacterized protein n=1 Tax=Mucilaginibacter antarcticus TaxID=1855725 RepID=A0ABW5XTE5_9SPHI
MKKLILALIFTVGFAVTGNAQDKPITPANYKENAGKVVTLCDTVYTVRIFSDTLTLLNMGGAYPKQKFTIAIKGNKLQMDWANLKKKHLCVTGTLELFKGTWQIVAAQPNEITVSK